MRRTRLLALLMLTPLLLAMQPTPDDPWTWSQFLTWMATPGGIVVVVGVALSFGVEYVPLFSALIPKWKRLAFFGLSVAVPCAAAVLGVWTDGWDPTWSVTFWPALQAGVLSFASGTLRQGYLPTLPNAPSRQEQMRIIGRGRR